MRRNFCALLTLTLIISAIPAFALSPGTDVLVPAAARVATWITDLYIFNPGTQATSVTVYWLVRDQANPSPVPQSFSVNPGETLVLDDVIQGTFGMNEGTGAFRVVADQPVVVNSRIYNLVEGVTFGQGFEGVPRGSAVQAGSSTDVVGLAYNESFRTNLAMIDASGAGSTVALTLLDAAGTQLATANYALDGFEPMLRNVTSVFSGVANFDAGTLHAEVTNGAVIVVGSKVDNDSATGDPTTLEAWSTACGSVDGTYQIAMYDSEEWATGGYLEIADGMVVNINGTYMNWDKTELCELIFPYGGPYLDIYPVADYASGVTFTHSYDDGGSITFTITFEIDDNQSISGTIDAVGNGFTVHDEIDDTGCNGTFPTETFMGGKAN
jgi:hypothetical protein